MKISGKVEFQDIETGAWVIRGDDGRTYELVGGDGGLRKPGQRVEVEGTADSGRVGFAMVGPRLAVRRYRVL